VNMGIRPLVNNGHRNHSPGNRSPCTHLRGSAPPDSDPLGSRPWDIPPLARAGTVTVQGLTAPKRAVPGLAGIGRRPVSLPARPGPAEGDQ